MLVLIDVHMLQNHAPSNLNRDDSGAPKDAIFGGVQRARISSQCLKRSIRRSSIFRDAFAADNLLAERTQYFPSLLRQELETQVADPMMITAIIARAPEFGKESKKQRRDEDSDEDAGIAEEQSDIPVTTADGLTAQLIFLSQAEITALAQKLVTLVTDRGEKAFAKMKVDEITRAIGSTAPRSVDIAMFGRMTTSAAFVDVAAAVQVAHALSTHRVQQEFDFYTAVDDISGQSGAGFIGDTAFNSATYYKYFSCHWEALVSNLGGDIAVAQRSANALVEAAALVQPTGKQNAFAAHNLPDLVLVEVRRRNLPVSYANAFLRPVRASGDHSLIDVSVDRLGEYMKATTETFGLEAERAFLTTGQTELPGATRMRSLRELMDWLNAQMVTA